MASSCNIRVQHAFSGEEIISIAVPATYSVYDLKLRVLEETTQIPAEYQTLLREGDVVPLRDTATLHDEGLDQPSVVLFTSREPKMPDLELWEACQGCRCDFREPNYSSCTDLSEKVCRCTRAPGRGPRLSRVKYLLRYLSDDVPFLQSVFERLVLAGGEEAYTLVAEHLAQDPRINVNAVGCSCSVPIFPSLLEVALDFQHVDMVRMLIDSGRLEVDYTLMCQRLKNQTTDHSEEVWSAAGRFEDSRGDRQSIVESIVANLQTRERTISKFIRQQGWQSEPFCKLYLDTYQMSIEHVFGDAIDQISQYANPSEFPALGETLLRRGHGGRRKGAQKEVRRR